MKRLICPLFLITFILILSSTSCNVYKSPVYAQLDSPKELSASYVDTHDRIAPYFNLNPDKADIYRFRFIDDKTLEFSRLAKDGYEVVKTYKGTHKKKQNYFQITLENRVIPLLIFNDIERDLLKLGMDKDKNLLLERNRGRTTSVLFFMMSEVLNMNAEVMNIYGQLTHYPMQKDSKWGYADKNDNFIINPKYDFVRTFEKDADVARVLLNDRWGLVAKNGEDILAAKYKIIERFDSLNYARVFNDFSVGLVDRKGNVILPIEYDKITHPYYSTSVSICELNKKKGVVDTDKLVYEPVFDEVHNVVTKDKAFDNVLRLMPNYLCEVKVGKQYYFADRDGYLFIRHGKWNNPTIEESSKIYYKDIFSKNKETAEK